MGGGEAEKALKIEEQKHLRVLIDEFGGVVDFVVNHHIQVLQRANNESAP